VALIIFGALAVIVYFFMLRGSFDTENVLREVGPVPPVVPVPLPEKLEIDSAQPDVSLRMREADYFPSTDFDEYFRHTPWLSKTETTAELDWNLQVPSKPESTIVTVDGKQYHDVSDYGEAFVPPTDEAVATVSAMNPEEQLNLYSLLNSLQAQWIRSTKHSACVFTPAHALLFGEKHWLGSGTITTRLGIARGRYSSWSQRGTSPAILFSQCS
jgi:hypothetical protein